MIIFTCDIDWAPEEVIADTLALFEQFNVKCTFFATHKSETLLNCNRKLFEIGLHPNFNLILEGGNPKDDIDKILKDLILIYPEAKGVRSHSMTQGTRILAKFSQYKLLYDANIFLPYHPNIKPFKLWDSFIRVPFNWEDDIHWMYGYGFSGTKLNLRKNLNILNFHPIHIYLNTENNKRYNDAKKDLSNLNRYKNLKGKRGTRDLLVNLLKMMQDKKWSSKTLSELLFL